MEKLIQILKIHELQTVMSLGERLRNLRQIKGFSQENMADMLHISTSAYGDIERNKTELTISRTKEIAKILEISFLELLGLNFEKMNQLSEKLNLENEKLRIENDKLRLEAQYWHEKFERVVVNEVNRISMQQERNKIGF